MKRLNRLSLLMLFALMGVVLSGCVGTRIGTSWSATELVSLYGQSRVMVAYNNILALVDADTGVATRLQNPNGEVRVDDSGNPRLWFVDGNSAEGSQFFARPVFKEVDGATTLLVPSFTNRILEVDLETARLNSPAGYPLTGPAISDAAVDDERIYLGLKLRDVVALDRSTLEQVWLFTTPAGIWAKPLLADGVLYVATVDHQLYALSAETGEPVWAQPVDLGGLAGASPLLYDGFLYIGSYSHKLFKISLQGEIVGEYEAQNWIWSTPSVFEGTLYLTDLSGYVHAVNPETMEGIWNAKHATRGIRPAPVVTDKYVIAASRDGRVYWLDRRDGALVFQREVEGLPEILSDLLYVPRNPAQGVAEDLVVVSTTDLSKLLVAYTVENGRSAWVYGR